LIVLSLLAFILHYATAFMAAMDATFQMPLSAAAGDFSDSVEPGLMLYAMPQAFTPFLPLSLIFLID